MKLGISINATKLILCLFNVDEVGVQIITDLEDQRESLLRSRDKVCCCSKQIVVLFEYLITEQFDFMLSSSIFFKQSLY